MNKENYLDKMGKVKFYPTKNDKKILVLNYLISKFPYNKVFTEKEVNNILKENIAIDDYVLLRRELVDNHLLARTNNGARYWKDDLVKEIETEHLLIKDKENSEFSYIKVIIAKDTQDTIASLELYCGYPDNETVFIKTLNLDDENYKQEVITAVTQKLKKYNTISLGIGISKDNHEEINYLSSIGFTELIRHDDVIELIKNLID